MPIHPEFFIDFDDFKTPRDISAAIDQPDEIPKVEKARIMQHTHIVDLRTR